MKINPFLQLNDYIVKNINVKYFYNIKMYFQRLLSINNKEIIFIIVIGIIFYLNDYVS